MSQNPYQSPNANLSSSENTSGMGKGHPIPPGVTGWSWGAFLLNWIWAIGNQTWIGLVALVPVIGPIMCFVLGFKGREWAWQSKKWQSVEHFNAVQKKWSFWAVILIVGFFVLGVLFAILVPMLMGTPDIPAKLD